jgi:hypothetical protein
VPSRSAAEPVGAAGGSVSVVGDDGTVFAGVENADASSGGGGGSMEIPGDAGG